MPPAKRQGIPREAGPFTGPPDLGPGGKTWLSSRPATGPAGSTMYLADDPAVLLASTDVLLPDINLHPSFPAQPAFRPPGPELDVLFRHSGWHRDRKRVYGALKAAFPNSTRVERFADCGKNAWVIRNEADPGSYAVASDHCHDRFCRPCARFKGHVIAHNVVNHLAGRPYRFVTFTIKNTGLNAKQGIDKLYRAFAMIRRSRLWQACVTGGVAFCELKQGSRGGTWHPHIHCVVEGKWLPQKALRKLWLRITGDSYIVDVRRGKDAKHAGYYCVKYTTKPFDDGTARIPTMLIEAIRALHGRRLAMTFGNWRGLRLCDYRPSGVWAKVCTLGQLRQRAHAGDDDAMALLEYLVKHHPGHRVPTPRAPPTPQPSPTSDD